MRPALLKSFSICRLEVSSNPSGRLRRNPAAVLTSSAASSLVMTPVSRPSASRSNAGSVISSIPTASIARLFTNDESRVTCRYTGLSGRTASSSSRVKNRESSAN